MPVRLEVKVAPRSAREKVTLGEGGLLKIALTAPPVDGEANDALIAFVARCLGLPRRDVTIVLGEKSRSKLIEVQLDDESSVRARLLGA